MYRKSIFLLLAALTVLSGADDAAAQRRRKKKKLKPCPYCQNDPTIMRKAGIVSHGPFTFGQAPKAEEGKLLTTGDVEKRIPFVQWYWVETRHCKIGASFNTYIVPDNEKKKFRREMEALKRMGLKKIKTTQRRIDPWLRMHLFAMRAENCYKHFQRVVGKTDADFPESKKDCFKGTGKDKKYMGMGPYLGQPEKYEILIAPNLKAYRIFVERYLGRRTAKPQRGNFTQRGALFMGLSVDMEGNRRDGRLHNSVVFNLSINLMDGYRFYAYNIPVWMTEGAGHYFERSVSPVYNSFDSNEGSVADVRTFWKWRPSLRTHVARGTVPSLAKVFRIRDYGSLRFIDHMVVWSLYDFLATRHSDKFAMFIDQMKGRLTKDGVGGVTDLLGVQRQAFKSIFGWTPRGLEEAWKKHVAETYPIK